MCIRDLRYAGDRPYRCRIGGLDQGEEPGGTGGEPDHGVVKARVNAFRICVATAFAAAVTTAVYSLATLIADPHKKLWLVPVLFVCLFIGFFVHTSNYE
jgi:hypothetical protein